jgi:hypothetical protein
MRAFILAALVVAYALAPAALQARADDKDAKVDQEFTGIASSIGTPGNPVGQAPVEIRITRWSNRDEQHRFLDALGSEGQEAALDRLQDLKSVGTIRINRQGLAYDLRYSQETRRPDGGRRIFLMTDRPISAWEAWAQPRVSDYPFTLVTMNLDKDGNGSGSIVLAARITGTDDGRFVQVENFATTPIQFNNIKETK